MMILAVKLVFKVLFIKKKKLPVLVARQKVLYTLQ